MEQLIELLKQIQELAGVAIDALEGAGSPEGAEKPPGGKPEGKPEGAPGGGEGPPPPDGGGPPPEGEGKPPFEKR